MLMKFKLVEEHRKFKIYTNGKIDKRVYDGDEPPQGFYPGSHYKKVAWNKGLTAETDERVKVNGQSAKDTRLKNGSYIAWNKGLTAFTDERVAKNIESAKETVRNKYGVDNIAQYIAKQDGYKVWNKGLTKETDARMKKVSNSRKGGTPWNKGKSVCGHPQSKESREKIRNAHLSPDFKQKRYDAMKSNNTLFVSDSKAEQEYYEYLKTLYSNDDIVRQYFDRDRYPFKCDFYIKSEDKFIEIHANWTHGGRPFDPNDAECQEQLAVWQEKAKTSKYFKNAIYQWTDLDVRKLKTAKQHNLNFEAIYH